MRSIHAAAREAARAGMASLVGAALLVSLPAAAQDLAAPPPPPALPADLDAAPDLEPQVRIFQRGEDTIEEHRLGGKLFMVKVTPRDGPTYYLMDMRGEGVFTRSDSLDTGIRVPMWLIRRF